MDVGGADLRSSIKKWKIIYPVYLNSKKTVAEGRRIAAAKACPDPTCIEIADSCAFLKIPRAIEVPVSFPPLFSLKILPSGILFALP
jgi:signal recognition particle subunit SRP19